MTRTTGERLVVVALSNPFTRETVQARIELVSEFEDIAYEHYYYRSLSEEEMAEFNATKGVYNIHDGHVWSNVSALEQILGMLDE